MADASNWEVLESLILAQAVYKYGDDSWAQVARVLRGHPALSRPPEFFAPKNCEKHFHTLLAEVVGDAETGFGHAGQDMPPLARLARKLHLKRIEEIKELLQKDEDEFRQLVVEIEEIRNGKWDDKLRAEWREQQEAEAAAAGKESASAANGQATAMDVDAMRANQTEPIPPQPTVVSEQPVQPIPNIKARRGRKPSRPAPPPPAPVEEPTASMDMMDIDEPQKQENAPAITAESRQLEGKAQVAQEEVPERAVKEGSASPVKGSLASRRTPIPPPRVRIPNPSADSDGMDMDSGAENSDGGSDRRRASKGDQTLQIWKKTVNFILAKIADHRYGNVFSAPVKEEGYRAVVKQPMSLDVVRARVRKGITATTSEFHRDLLLMITNALMYNNEDSEVYSMALEMKQFVDAEVQHLTKYGADPGRERSVDPEGRARTEEPGTPGDVASGTSLG